MDGVSMLPKKTINGFTSQTLDWYEGILSQFPGEHRRKSKTDADVICPVHDDHNPSLGVDLRRNGAGPKIVLNCRSQGCEYSEILQAVGVLTPLRSTVQNYLRTSTIPSEVHTEGGVVVIVCRTDDIDIGLRFAPVLSGKQT